MNIVEQQIQPVEKAVENVEKPIEQPVEEQKKLFSFPRPRLINSPWVLLAAPLTAGGVWLASNTWVITNNLNKPYALLAGPALVGSIIALYVLLMFFKAIVAMLKGLGNALVAWFKKPGAIFWVGTGIFLVVSIAEGSSVYDEIFKNTFHGLLGFAAAVSIDAVSVTCILARQDASRRNNTFGKNFFMIGIVACALISTIANGYITTEHYSAPTNIAGTAWVVGAYALGLVPPLFIVFLGFASDYISDQKASSLDPDAFQKSERDRLRFYEIQLETLKERRRINDEMNRLNGIKERRVFFLINWLFPQKGISSVHLEEIKDQIGILARKSDYLYQQFTNALTQNQEMYARLSSQMEANAKQYDADLVSIDARFREADSKLEEYFLLTDLLPNSLAIPSTSDDPSVSTNDMYLEAESETDIDTGERESVSKLEVPMEAPRPRITVKLDGQERNTDNLAPTRKKTTSKAPSTDNEVIKRVRRIVKRNPDIRPVDLAEKVGITRQYAGTLKARIVDEMSAQ